MVTQNSIIGLSLIPLLALLLVACGGNGNDASETNTPATGQATPEADAPDAEVTLCLAHNVAADLCFICDAELRDPGRLWCAEHGRYEDRCWVCHPELQDNERLYCNEHGIYEDECFICHPELELKQSSANTPETIGTAEALSDALYCNEHDVREVECGICQPALADRLLPGESLKIRLPSLLSESKANIVSAHPQSGPAQSSVHAVGELRFNQNRLVHVTPLTDGIVRRVHVDLGQMVKKGQVLAELNSPQIAESKAELLKAVAEETVSSEALSRARGLHEQNVLSAQDLYDAEARHTTARASLRAAEQMLIDLGFDRQSLDRIISEQETQSVLPLAAPFTGTVIARHAVVGELVSLGDQMFSIADLSTLWLNLAVSERDVAGLRVGQPVAIRSHSLDREIMGKITYVANQLNETTRMAEVRAEVDNPHQSLRAGMFVDATINVTESATSLLVPRDTVHRFGGNTFVFVRIAGDLYELRRVETRPASEQMTAVTAGLTGTDMVAVEQSYLLKSEFHKSRMGAGCAD